MSWSRLLEEPIALANGKKLRPLNDAANFILKLPKAKQAEPRWCCVTAALMSAAESDGFYYRDQANLQLWRALRTEGMLAQTQKETARA